MSPHQQFQSADIKYQQTIVRKAFDSRKLPYSVANVHYFSVAGDLLCFITTVFNLHTKDQFKTSSSMHLYEQRCSLKESTVCVQHLG